jgi:hypothetical protein
MTTDLAIGKQRRLTILLQEVWPKESHAHIASDRKTLSQKVEVSNYGHAALDQLKINSIFCVRLLPFV